MTSTRQAPIVRVAHAVGDFGNPFYAEERHRDVWNEASAFGLQLVLWAALTGCATTVWLVGRESVPYVCTVLGVVGLVCWLTMAYAHRLGVDVVDGARVLRWRLLPYLGLLAAVVAGVLRATADGPSSSFARGMAVGAVLGALGAAVALLRNVLRR